MKTYRIGEANESHAFITDDSTGNDVAVIRRGEKYYQAISPDDWQKIVDAIHAALCKIPTP